MTPCQRILVVEDNRADAVLLEGMLLRDAPGAKSAAWLADPASGTELRTLAHAQEPRRA